MVDFDDADEYEFDDFWVTDSMMGEMMAAKANGTFAGIVRDRQGEVDGLLTRKQSERWANEARSIRIELMNLIIAQAVHDEVTA
jgi:hypothetical protein